MSTGWPQGESTLTTRAPARAATSHRRAPKTPFTPTTTTSPGLTTLTTAHSIPADPVPETGMVRRFWVRNTSRSMPWVPSMIWRNSGSRWPSTGAPSAANTSGWQLLGPGPKRTRESTGATLLSTRPPGGEGGATTQPYTRPVDLSKLAEELQAVSPVADHPLEVALYSRDASIYQGQAGLVVFPTTTTEVQECVRAARRH